MLLQIQHPDRKLQPALEDWTRDKVHQHLGRFESRLTRIELHFQDVNAHKSGIDDKRITLEARARGRQPLAVTAANEDWEKAVLDAVHKMKALLEHEFGRRTDKEK